MSSSISAAQCNVSARDVCGQTYSLDYIDVPKLRRVCFPVYPVALVRDIRLVNGLRKVVVALACSLIGKRVCLRYKNGFSLPVSARVLTDFSYCLLRSRSHALRAGEVKYVRCSKNGIVLADLSLLGAREG